MSGQTLDSLRNMCRTCMSAISNVEKANNRKKQDIYEVPFGSDEATCIMELLQIVQPQIKVQIMDNLPKQMCSDCVKKLQVTYKFLEMYKDVDEKFRKMVKELELEETVEFIEENNHIEDNFDNEDEMQDVNKFEIEIEKINDEAYQEEEYENINIWPEFEEEPIQEMSDEDVEKNEFFDNPYSDASDNEWNENDTSKNQTPSKISPKKQKRDFELKKGPISANNSTSIKTKQKVSKNRVAIADINIPTPNDDGSLTCPECDDVLDNVRLWQKHMHQHRLGKVSKRKYDRVNKKPRKTFKCEHCDKVFPRATAYNNHVRTHTGEEPFLCIVCGKSFKVVSSLNTHMLRHKGEKTIQCPHCPKKFVCSSGLYGHMMVHTKEKSYVCDICGSAFHMAYQLRKHNLYHNNIKNYQCEYCDMRFVTGEKQRRHMRTHTGEKPYRCKYCERAFAQSNDCVKHLRQHLGDNVYQCELCPLRFPLARDLRVHFASHKDDNEDTRARNLEARMEEERNLQIKLGVVQEV